MKTRALRVAVVMRATALRTRRCRRRSGPQPPRASAPAVLLAARAGLPQGGGMIGRLRSGTTMALRSAAREGPGPSRRARRPARLESAQRL